MSQSQMELTVFVCLKDVDVRAQWAGLLTQAEAALSKSLPSGQMRCDVCYTGTLEDAETQIVRLFRERPGRTVILLSDTLLHPDDNWRPEWRQTSALKSLRAEFADHSYLSLAVDEQDGRIPDVDLVLSKRPGVEKLLAGLRLLIERARYYSKPVDREKPKLLSVRALNSQTELREAFKLRFSVYRVMGYLDDDALDTENQMELDGCDCWSNHFGAFVDVPGRGQELVGTARLILTSRSDPRSEEWTRRTAVAQSLRRLLERKLAELAQFRLPIFHTLPLNEQLQKAFSSSRPWAELSRVIVAPNYRGAKIAHRLVTLALEVADRLPAEAVLLECLELHRGMYERMGFMPLGQRGEVMGVGKTMIGLQRLHPLILASEK